MTTFRGFIAIEIPPLDKIKKIHREISSLPTGIKLVEPENIHITLKFLGETKREDISSLEEIMQSSVKDMDPFSMVLKGTGVFPNKNYMKIIWIGMEQVEQVRTISSTLNGECARLGYKKEKRGFKPHVTIGRVKNAVGKDQLIQLIERYEAVVFGEIMVDQILLKKSTLTPKGPMYETMRTVTL